MAKRLDQDQRLWTVRTAHGEKQFSLRDWIDYDYKRDPVGTMERVARARAERDQIPPDEPGQPSSILRRAHRLGLSMLADYVPPCDRMKEEKSHDDNI